MVTEIYHNGKKLNPEHEHEIFRNDKLGMTIGVKNKNGDIDVYNNITEFHWRHETLPNDPRVAFESDIHMTGSTRSIKDIVWVEITPAKVIAENF